MIIIEKSQTCNWQQKIWRKFGYSEQTVTEQGFRSFSIGTFAPFHKYRAGLNCQGAQCAFSSHGDELWRKQLL